MRACLLLWVTLVLGVVNPVLAQLVVDEVDGNVQVGARGEGLAVFQPEPNLVWVVVPGTSKIEIAGSVAGRAGWQVEKLRVENGAGVALRTPQPRTWRVDGAKGNWTVGLVGNGGGGGGVLSGVILKDGLVGALAVSDASGRRFRVLPQADARVDEGMMGELATQGMRLIPTERGIAEVVAGTVQVAKVTAPELAAIPLKEIPVAKVKEPRQKVEVVEVEAVSPFKRGPSLRAVDTPVGKYAARVEDVEPAAGPEEGGDVSATGVTSASVVVPVSVTFPIAEYEPGRVIPFSLPSHYRLEQGRLRKVSGSAEVQRKLEFARAYGAVRDAADRAERAAELQLLPPNPQEDVQVAAHQAEEAVLHNEPERVHEAGGVSGTSLEHIKDGHSEIAVAAEHGDAATEGQGHEEEGAGGTAVAAVSGTVLEVPDEGDANGLFPVAGSPRKYMRALQNLRVLLARAEQKSGAVIAVLPGVSASAVAVEGSGHSGGPKLPAEVPEAEPTPAWVKSPQEVAEAPEVVRIRRLLVAFYLAWQRPEEAAAEIALMPQREGMPAAAADRFYLALSHVMRGQGDQALEMLEKDETYRPADRALWKAVALQQIGQSAASLQAWPRNEVGLKGYPSKWQQLALRNRAEALLAAGNQATAMTFADDAAREYPAQAVPSAWRRLQGISRMRTREEQKGLEYLAQAAADERDPKTAYVAKYEFVQALLRRGELEDRQVTDYLEDLRLLWRGDELESRMLNQLGEYYLRQRDYRNALNRWRTLVRVYPNTPAMTGITENMTRAVLGAFDPENPDQYDALTYIGLYFDFRELLPDDDRGDRVMETAGRYLIETELAERAVPVLEQVLYYRSREPIDQARIALLLSAAYRESGKADLAIQVLDKYKSKAVNTVQQQQWPFAEAKALLALNQPAEAKKALGKSTGPELPGLLAEADWQLQDWQALKATLEPVVARIRPISLPKSVINQVHVLRLAYAYGQLGERQALEGLMSVYGDIGATLPAMADTLAAISTEAGVAKGGDAGRPLAEVAGSLAALNAFTDKFKQDQEAVERRRLEQEEYNNKMRYMDLLPPPSI